MDKINQSLQFVTEEQIVSDGNSSNRGGHTQTILYSTMGSEHQCLNISVSGDTTVVEGIDGTRTFMCLNAGQCKTKKIKPKQRRHQM
jgi:hypothetical protein